jgi:hypothetical protein
MTVRNVVCRGMPTRLELHICSLINLVYISRTFGGTTTRWPWPKDCARPWGATNSQKRQTK